MTMVTQSSCLNFILLHLLFVAVTCREQLEKWPPSTGGRWEVLQNNIFINAMHMQLLPNDKVVMFDYTSFGHSGLSLPRGKCRGSRSKDRDCTAHSILYDTRTNSLRALFLETDVWCSSGALDPSGTLIQSGGFGDGSNRIRKMESCNNGRCDWVEIPKGLLAGRWYPTSQILPDGRVIIIGGRGADGIREQFHYEFYPKDRYTGGLYELSFLRETLVPNVGNNLYPFVFLNVDGNLFIFANNRAILYDYRTKTVVRKYPVIGGDPRNYPNTGSAVLLPMRVYSKKSIVVEVLVCGGAPTGAFPLAMRKTAFLRALDTCGRIKINDKSPQWVMEKMPMPRVMSDMILLPNGDVLIVNGAKSGSAGWECGRDPILNPILYRPYEEKGRRFAVLHASSIPRMYHSTAILIRDGHVLVGGSNPHEFYELDERKALFPTELRLEAFSPPYLDKGVAHLRPIIRSLGSYTKLEYNQRFVIQFSVPGSVITDMIRVTMMPPAFNTHSFSMSQRLLVVGANARKSRVPETYETIVVVPKSANVAPPGYYMMFIVHQGIPSIGIWVHVSG